MSNHLNLAIDSELPSIMRGVCGERAWGRGRAVMLHVGGPGFEVGAVFSTYSVYVCFWFHSHHLLEVRMINMWRWCSVCTSEVE